MSTLQLLDAAGRRRSPATLPGIHAGRPPRNKGFRYPPDPPRVEEIVAVMRQAGATDHGLRVRALIVVLWRAGLRIGEAMALTEPDLDPGRGSVLIRQGKGGKRREVGMDQWGFDQLVRGLPVGSACRSARCSAFSTVRPVAVPGRPLLRATTCGASQPRLAYAPLRAAPAPPRACGRDGTRRRPAEGDPAPARPRQPRRDLGLPRRD